MARFDTNRSAEMEVFLRVVDLGGFTPAARKLRLTPSGVSKLISRLEARLGSRLVNRTTRKLTLTEEGGRSTSGLFGSSRRWRKPNARQPPAQPRAAA